ncbi:MAG: response regulator [Candidatus Omnitrophota bacterium]
MAKRVLIADDDKALLMMLESALKDAGYEVLLAEDGEEALQKAKSQKPDLLLIDAIMPKVSGYELVQKIASEPDDTSRIPVIILSARRSMSTLFEEFAVRAFLAKPLKKDDVISAVDAVFGIVRKPPSSSEKPLSPEALQKILENKPDPAALIRQKKTEAVSKPSSQGASEVPEPPPPSAPSEKDRNEAAGAEASAPSGPSAPSVQTPKSPVPPKPPAGEKHGELKTLQDRIAAGLDEKGEEHAWWHAKLSLDDKTHILLAGTQDMLLKKISGYFHQLGYQITLCHTPKEILETAEREQPKFVFCQFWDEVSEFMTEDIYCDLKKNKATAEIPVMVFCYAALEDRAIKTFSRYHALVFNDFEDLQIKLNQFFRIMKAGETYVPPPSEEDE